LNLIGEMKGFDYLQFTGTRKGIKSSWSPISLMRRESYFNIIVPLLKAESSLLYQVFKKRINCDFSGWGVPSWGGLGHKYSFHIF